MAEIWNAKDVIWAYFGEGFHWDFKMFYLFINIYCQVSIKCQCHLASVCFCLWGIRTGPVSGKAILEWCPRSHIAQKKDYVLYCAMSHLITRSVKQNKTLSRQWRTHAFLFIQDFHQLSPSVILKWKDTGGRVGWEPEVHRGGQCRVALPGTALAGVNDLTWDFWDVLCCS